MMLAADIVYQPVLSPLHILAVALGLGALAIAAYLRHARTRPVRSALLCLMRLAAIVTLAALLTGPSYTPQSSVAPVRPRLNILLDVSGSMLTADVDDSTRLQAAIDRWLAPDQLDTLSQTFDIRLNTFADDTQTTTAAALSASDADLSRGRATHYAQSITDVLLTTTRRPGDDNALLLLGDGHDSDNRPLAPAIMLAKSRNTAVHTVVAGSDTQPRDLALIALPTQEYLLADEPGSIIARIYQVGLDDGSATLHIRQGDDDQTRSIRFEGRQSASVELPVRQSEPGVYEYQLAVEPVAGEAVTQNNRASVFLQVTQKRVRVLMLEGEPFWDTKFIAQSLRSDPRIELTQITEVTPGRRESIVTRRKDSPADLPRTLEAMSAYDVIILGRGIEFMHSPAELKQLTEYVAQGAGHVVFARGRAYDPDTPAGRDAAAALRVLEPVTWQRGLMQNLPLHLTAVGRAHAAFNFTGIPGSADTIVGAMSSMGVMQATDHTKAATIVLAEAGKGPSAAPAIVTMNYGRGRVFAVLGEGLWRWSFLPPELSQYKGVYDALWSNIVRWLAMGGEFQPGQQVAMRLSRASIQAGDEIGIDVTTRFTPPPNFDPKLTITDPSGDKQTVPLKSPSSAGRYSATLKPQATGVWQVTLDASPLADQPLTQKFSVYDLNLERLRTAARPDVMRSLAEQTGGMHFDVRDTVNLADTLARRRASKIIPPRPRYVWDHGWLMALLVIWLGLEWIGRRNSGWL
ncbi:hypothetical protein HED60_02890 [Planctomycetales bacterium ZRK34]|nr:hypothetical protein HED60_02890 [Planctomycetales bacterium ZRK34]